MKKIVSDLTFNQVEKAFEQPIKKEFCPQPIELVTNTCAERAFATDIFMTILGGSTAQVDPFKMIEVLEKFKKMIQEQL